MLRKISLLLTVFVFTLALAVTAYADPGKPDFSGGVYADGELWGTKRTTELPGPNGHNNQSFDQLFVFNNSTVEQKPVSEAGPGNPMYNGGRWSVQSVEWIGGEEVVLTSYEEIMDHYEMGHLKITEAETYFQCPLLPTK